MGVFFSDFRLFNDLSFIGAVRRRSMGGSADDSGFVVSWEIFSRIRER